MSIKQIDAKDSIEEFVERYWPIEFSPNPEKPLEEIQEEHQEYLRRKYGCGIIDCYNDFSRKLYERNNRKNYDALNSFVFETGLVEDAGFFTPQRSKATLSTLLNFLSDKKNTLQQFNLTDLGTGDGKIAIGLALYLEDLERIYAIDYNEQAIKRIEKNITNLSKEEQFRISDKIVLVRMDYTDEKAKAKFIEEIGGTDFVLAAYTYRGLEKILPHIKAFMKPFTGKILRYNEFPIDPPNINLAMEFIAAEKNEIANQFGVQFSPLCSYPIIPSRDYLFGFLGEFTDTYYEDSTRSK